MPSGRSGALLNSSGCSFAWCTERTLHRKSIWPDTGLDARPSYRSGDRKGFAYAWRIGAYCCRPTAISQVVQEYAAAATSLGREHIVLRVLIREAPDQPQRVPMRLTMHNRLLKRRHNMDTLSTGELRPCR